MTGIISIILSLLISFLSWIAPMWTGRAKLMVANMTLEQKIGQMIMPAFRTWNDGGTSVKVTELNEDIANAIKKYGFGGVCLFAENTQGTEQTVRLVNQLQTASKEGTSKIPLLLSIDQEGGYIVRLQTGTCTPGNMALGALNDENETRSSAEIISSELKSLGINTDFAPDLDINDNPSNPVIGVRSFSSSPDIVANNGKAYIQGLHDNNIVATAKHFPGHGNTSTDSHTSLPLVNRTYEEIKNNELIPFKTAIDSGVDIIMTAHIEFPLIETKKYKSITTGEEINLPATLSKTIITDILRKDMGYDGVVCTDALEMDGIAKNIDSKDAAVLAVNAGVDILLMPITPTCKADLDKLGEYIQNIVDAVKSGEIKESRIDEAVERIIKLKIKRGILNTETDNVEEKVCSAKNVVGSYEHYMKNMETAEKAVTIYKNDGILPLKAKTEVLFFYPYAGEDIPIQYMLDWLEGESVLPKSFNASVLNFRNKAVEDFKKEIGEASVIITYSGLYNSKYLNPYTSVGWQAKFNDELIEFAHNNGKKVVVVSFQLPYDVARYQDADAIIAVFCEKDMTEIPNVFNGETKTFGVNLSASVSALYGYVKPQGKSPVDIYEIDDEYSFSEKILYPVGYGLTY